MENSSVLRAGAEWQLHRTHPVSLCRKVTSSHSFWVTPLFCSPSLLRAQRLENSMFLGNVHQELLVAVIALGVI